MSLPVSIVIPAYNAERYISQQIESLLPQITQNDEIIISDNGSTDNTVAVVEKYSAQNLPIRVVDASEKQGANFARNKGILASSNEKIILCDADDISKSNLVSELRRKLETVDISGGSFVRYIWDINKNRYIESEIQTEPPLTVGNTPYAVSCCMGISRSLFLKVGGFDNSYRLGHEEVDFALRVAEAGGKFGWISTPLLKYRQRDTPISKCKQQFHYARTSVQLVQNFSPKYDYSVPTYRLLIRKQISAILNLGKNIQNPTSRVAALEGLAWTTGRLYGTVLYRLLKKLPARELIELDEV